MFVSVGTCFSQTLKYCSGFEIFRRIHTELQKTSDDHVKCTLRSEVFCFSTDSSYWAVEGRRWDQSDKDLSQKEQIAFCEGNVRVH